MTALNKVKYHELHQATRDDIEGMADAGRPCECAGNGRWFYLCEFHEGFDDAAVGFSSGVLS